VLPINPGPAGAPCPRGRNPGRRQQRLRLREGLLPRVARMERPGPVCVGRRVPATIALPPARSDRIVGVYLRVLFGGRQSRTARRRSGHRRVLISAPRAACAPSTLGPPRRETISPREPALNAKSRQLATSPTPLGRPTSPWPRSRRKRSALSVSVARATACGPIAKRVSPRRFSAFRIKVLPRAISLTFA
jgi:hypothetical protein